MTRLAVAPPWTAASSINLGRATPVIPIAIRRPSSPPCRPLLNEMVNAPRQQTAGAEIPIASDAQLRQISRGFLPWRFSDAGPGVRGAVAMGRHPKTFTEPDIAQLLPHVCSFRLAGPVCGAPRSRSAFRGHPGHECARRVRPDGNAPEIGYVERRPDDPA